MDLKLIPIEELIQELKDRTETLVVGYTRNVDNGAPIIYKDWNGPSYITASGLCDEVKLVCQAHGRENNYPSDLL